MSKGSAELWFAFPDIHFPLQDKKALAVAVKAHKLLNPDNTVFLGDVLDCSIFSSHANKTIAESQTYDFKKVEIDPANELLDIVQKNTKKNTYLLEGNHEWRVERWAANNNRVGESIYDLISPKATLSQGRKNFTYIPYTPVSGNMSNFLQIAPNNKKMKTGGLVAIHGWSHAKHSSYRHLELSRTQSILHGHVHRQQSIATRDPWHNRVIKAFCPGTLSVLQPLYAHGGTPTDWVHGFAIIYVGTRSWTEYNITIVNNQCVLPCGTEITI
jgi:hypothetical protein